MRGVDRGGVRDAVLQVAGSAAGVSVVIGFTVLGASVVMGRGLISLVSRLFPRAGGPTPRHHAGRVHEQARAAERAARAAGVLKR